MDVWEWVPRLLGLWVVASVPVGLLIGRGMRQVSVEAPAAPVHAVEREAQRELSGAVRVA